jgi:flagellar motor switch/type III secretory pathway protein FliN
MSKNLSSACSIKISASDASNIRLVNQAIALEASVYENWSIHFRYALPGRPCRCNYAIKGKDVWLDIPVYEVTLDHIKLTKLAQASGRDQADQFASQAVLDLLQQCSDRELKEKTNFSCSPPKREHQLILTAHRDGLEVRLLISAEILLCLNRLWPNETGYRARTDDSLKKLAFSMEILHNWLDVTITELQSWRIGDFLAICTTNGLERTGIKLETVDRHGFVFAELTFSKIQTRVTKLVAHNSKPQIAQNLFDSPENTISSQFLRLMKDDKMPDTVHNIQNPSSPLPSRHTKKKDESANALRVSFPVSLHLGTLRMTLAEIESLRPGQIVDFQTNTNSDVSVYVGDNKVALGTLCEINGNFGIMLRQLII